MRCGRLAGVVGLALAAASCAGPREGTLVSRAVGRDITLAPDTLTFESRVPPNATLNTLLRSHNLSDDLVLAIVHAVKDVFDPRHLRADNPYRLVRTIDGLLRRFEYHVDGDRFLRILPQSSDLSVELVPYEKRREPAAASGTIDRDRSSLVAAMDAAGEGVTLAIALAEVFSGEIDFSHDLQPGDSFQVAFEKVYRDRVPDGYGTIHAAEFVNDGRRLRAFRFDVPGRGPGYYDEQGRSLKRFFLRSPLRFEPVVTSRFSARRLHPVLREYRAHHGVDYRASYGAPVVAVADGVVTAAGQSGGAGRMVSVRHSNGYESSYLHLSSIGVGVRPGVRVSQGTLVGRVGASGLATGPHLDYRLKKHGVFVNPLAEHRRLPPGEPIPPEHLAAFHDARARVTFAPRASAPPANQ